MRTGLNRTFAAVLVVSAVLIGCALGLIFLVAPEEKVMGAVQKIFYFHAWGVWWTWEAKLTTTLILWLLLAGCLLARRYAATPEQGARIGAVLGIVAALDVPIVYKAVDWWRGQHPIVFGPGKTNPLAPGMSEAFGVSMLAVLTLYLVLLIARIRLSSLEERIAELEDASGRFR